MVYFLMICKNTWNRCWYHALNHLLELKWIAVLYGIDWFLFCICASRHSKVMAFFPESYMKKGKWWSVICNYKQPCTNPCVSSMKLKQSIKDSLCYSESIYRRSIFFVVKIFSFFLKKPKFITWNIFTLNYKIHKINFYHVASWQCKV